MSSLPGFIKVSFEFEQPMGGSNMSKIQTIKRDLRLINKNKANGANNSFGTGKLLQYNPNGKTKKMPVARSIRPLPRRSVNI